MDLIFRFPISATLKENESKRRHETTPQTVGYLAPKSQKVGYAKLWPPSVAYAIRHVTHYLQITFKFCICDSLQSSGMCY